MIPYESSLEHLLAEARRIDLMLRREILKVRMERGQSSWDEFRGLYISESEVDGLLSSSPATVSMPAPASTEPGELAELTRSLVGLEREISARVACTRVELRLEHLMRAFNLSRFETDCMLIAVLPELDLRYQRLYAYLQDDVTRRCPTVDLARVLLAPSTETGEVRAAFLPHGRLLGCQLVTMTDPPGHRDGSLLDRAFNIDQRAMDYLLGSDAIDSRLSSFARLVSPTVRLSDLLLPGDLMARLGLLLGSCTRASGPTVCLHGRPGSGKRLTAEAICGELGAPLLVVNSSAVAETDLPPGTALSLIMRESSLQRSCVFWQHFDRLVPENARLDEFRHAVLEASMSCPQMVLIGTQAPWEPAVSSFAKPLLTLEVPIPPLDIRRQMWSFAIARIPSSLSETDIDALAAKFRFSGGQIMDAVADAHNAAVARAGTEARVATNDIYRACNSRSNQRLRALARHVRSTFTWEDIVLPKDQLAQLREITNHVRFRHIVFDEWNFDRKVALGRGLNVLFAGPSGTGKTMAAGIMAGDLNLDLFKIDLSTVVSKYIGETEKNLDRIFREAQDSNAILFFDEADAIFGKRSEVRDSHDRYANIEIAYLLQRMEEYDGIVILATNLRKNLDESFTRRMQFCVDFPLPDETDRYRIWRGMFPSEAPLSSDADLDFVARRFKISGGNIKNIALEAAFLAASDGEMITTGHLVRATRREYQKMGRLCNEADFSPYYELVKG